MSYKNQTKDLESNKSKTNPTSHQQQQHREWKIFYPTTKVNPIIIKKD